MTPSNSSKKTFDKVKDKEEGAKFLKFQILPLEYYQLQDSVQLYFGRIIST